MKRRLILLYGLFLATTLQAQQYSEKDVHAFQMKLNKEFASEKESPLEPSDRKHFKSLDFFPANPTFCVVAKFIRTPNEKPFPMKTSTSRTPMYVKYGELHFTLEGKACVLNLYKPTAPGEDYYFLPFTDLTNGEETYGGGRYIDLEAPGDTVVIDFNKAYNPYCAYSGRYSCPRVPKENHLEVAVKAGVKKFHD